MTNSLDCSGCFELVLYNFRAMLEGYQLPEKWSEEAVDENGNKLSKRYVASVGYFL